MKNYHVEFDLEDQNISFQKHNCGNDPEFVSYYSNSLTGVDQNEFIKNDDITYPGHILTSREKVIMEKKKIVRNFFKIMGLIVSLLSLFLLYYFVQIKLE